MNKQQREVLMYLVFGVLTTVVNFIVYYGLIYAGVPYLPSNALAIVAAILFAYLTNKIFVFKSKDLKRRENIAEFLRFITARLASGLIDMVVLFTLVEWMGVTESKAKLVGQVLVVIINYVFSKWFIFQK